MRCFVTPSVQRRHSMDDASNGNTARAALIANYYDNILHFLEVHHESEEQLVFPLLRQRCPADGPTVDRMEAEHTYVLGLLQQAQPRRGHVGSRER